MADSSSPSLGQYLRNPTFILSFITCSILGTFTRLGLEKLTDYEGSYVSSHTVLWPNFVACIFLGFVQTLNKHELGDKNMSKCLSSGYAGTVSSFSAFIVEVFLRCANLQEGGDKLPKKAYGIMEFFSVIIVQLFTSISALVAGIQSALMFIDHFNLTNPDNYMTIFLNFLSSMLYVAAAMAAIPLALALIILPCFTKGKKLEWILSALFGILGSLLRFILTVLLNDTDAGEKSDSAMQFGTSMANIIATAIACVLTILKNGDKNMWGDPIINSYKICIIIEALNKGFCVSRQLSLQASS